MNEMHQESQTKPRHEAHVSTSMMAMTMFFFFHYSSFQLEERKVNTCVSNVLYMCARLLLLFWKDIVFVISKIVINGLTYITNHT